MQTTLQPKSGRSVRDVALVTREARRLVRTNVRPLLRAAPVIQPR